MTDNLCSKCQHIHLAHTGKKGTVDIGPGMALHANEGWCLQGTPGHCFSFEFKKEN